ncbi:MAG: argininosuccinate lyase [Actinomycetota bacterium]|nr:argininosuccinate lyase [Actinomycetota bacterium]
MTLWHGRFASEPSRELWDYTQSLTFDRTLALDDIVGSKAHLNGLYRVGIISEAEYETVLGALNTIEGEIKGASFAFLEADEDIHTAIERRVTEIAGDAGAKLHTGRSRNDQVATDLRLFVRRELLLVADRIIELEMVLADLAEEAKDAYMPGYTHMQKAQPVLFGHHLLAHGWALRRDVDRITDTLDRLDVSPLGAGALGGSTLPIDPQFTSQLLHFAGPFENSLDAVSDRDFVAEALFNLSLIAVHLSRIGEEIVLWSTEEFGYVRLDDGYSTGSSMLPQKKNPDIAELARGKTGRLIGHLGGFLTTLKGLPLSYNRDLQEDKEPLFDSINQISRALSAVKGMLATATFDFSRMKKSADSPYLCAIDLAEFLVRQHVPFRKAHAVVGGLVRDSLERHVPLEELVAAHPLLGEEAAKLLEPGASVQHRISRGGAGVAAVEEQRVIYREAIQEQLKRIGSFDHFR